jgi:hypothetical protein
MLERSRPTPLPETVSQHRVNGRVKPPHGSTRRPMS